MATLAERLTEAEKAWHDLMTGQALVAVYDSNGERDEFRPANRDALRLYILDLKSQIAGAAKPARKIQFQTSKGV